MELLRYMKNDENHEWATLKEEHHIDVATRQVRRLSTAIHIALLFRFAAFLPIARSNELLDDLDILSGKELATKWHACYQKFIDHGCQVNATFALHVDFMTQLDGISAIALAERLGGNDGYHLLLASTKESLVFSFLNGATSYSPYSVKLLYEHYRAGHFYGNLKKYLFSTPLKGDVNMATDTKREVDHQFITKGFRSASTSDSIRRKTALADDLAEVTATRRSQRHKKTKQKEDHLSYDFKPKDCNLIYPTALMILNRGGLDLSQDAVPQNVYAGTKTVLPVSILNRNCTSVGTYLISKYVAKLGLFNCSACDIPSQETLEGPKDLLDKVKRSKGTTIKRMGRNCAQQEKSDRDQKEAKRKKEVVKIVKRTECLTSDMNTCQALVKPDCSKYKVEKSRSMSSALKELLCDKLKVGQVSMQKRDHLLSQHGLIYSGRNNSRVLPYEEARYIKIMSLEFAGVKFKSRAMSGLDYIKEVEDLLENKLGNFPYLERMIICEEKYSFTPDTFKAATRDQRRQSTKPSSISHLKSGRELLSAEIFSKSACMTSPEGKSLISTYVAQNADKLNIKHNIIIDIDSEMYVEGCTCSKNSDGCKCEKFCIPVRCFFDHQKGFKYSTKLDGISQRKGEAEMSQVDWIVSSLSSLEQGDGVISYVTSGDIDAIPIHLFTVSSVWPRRADGSFKHPVYTMLQKPSGTEVYNITAIIQLLEEKFADPYIAQKVALSLCIGGNDYIPKFYGISHTAVIRMFLSNEDFYKNLFHVPSAGVESFSINPEKYVEFVKNLYCPKRLKPEIATFEDVRKSTMIKCRKSTEVLGPLDHLTDPPKWMPPRSAIQRLAELIQLQIDYLLTTGKHDAKLPEFLAKNCLVKNPSGHIEYDFGEDSHVSASTLTEMVMSSIKTPTKKKRKAEDTPQKGLRRKLPLKSSTPRKLIDQD